ncbi:F420-non-reducing hydrogenase subunit G [Geomonas limicola]|uniref:F420-non-reducing hydrogenase subunit G n=1 Tax=Geomonas limicola TaxID=2740186 RepID=A0A6V8N4T5_9BACT|nr:oxidoreductase [Geomonas limicola]GFO67390.1 F420-non-reducing hydrogenase subunit G [Geomonas limicola]
MATDKPKLAMYWAAACGGCEISLANMHEAILELDRDFDFVFCPCFLDTKKKDLEAMPDGSIRLTLFNGSLRTEENLEMARLLRKKSQLLVAFGSCAVSGGVPALANQRSRDELLSRVYLEAPGTVNPDRLFPRVLSQVPEGELTLPEFLDRIPSLKDAVPVEYLMPGCPPEPERILAVLRLVASGEALPDPGTVLGCSATRAVCDECTREKRDQAAPALVRSSEALPEPGWCLVEQGVPCLGMATKGGCGALCPAVQMPCSGCYGPLDPDGDAGGAGIAALSGAVAAPVDHGAGEAQLVARSRATVAAVADPLGTFYRYTLSDCLIGERDQEVVK